MSARKLGRLAGLVFVLAAFLGGVGAAGAEHAAGGESAAAKAVTLSIDWE
ncbi:MAG: hypothetical protein ACJ786_27625 [Catenulispora sp.]|jgi:hypothetical protein